MYAFSSLLWVLCAIVHLQNSAASSVTVTVTASLLL